MIVARFAPSPTGRLHIGHAYSAVVGHSEALKRGGKFLLRIEDLDQGRARAEYVDAIVDDLRWLGLDWEEPVLMQSERTPLYSDALGQLRDRGLAYACFCTRSDIASALAAPHGPVSAHYPGTCRNLPDDPARRRERPHCWRLDSGRAIALVGFPRWREGPADLESSPADFDDIILARKDMPAAYHLACVVDDSDSGVTLVTRGCDLRSSTPVQRLLQSLLGLAEPDYCHHRLVGQHGRRLAKRDRAPTLAAMREAGVDGPELARQLENGQLPLGFGFLAD